MEALARKAALAEDADFLRDGVQVLNQALLELDGEAERFRTRRLDGAYPYLWLDATFVKVRAADRVMSQAIVIAMGVRARGEREVLEVDVGQSDDGALWLGFLRSLVARGLGGVQLVMSDAHQRLKGAIGAVPTGASWQRCRVRMVLAERLPTFPQSYHDDGGCHTQLHT